MSVGRPVDRHAIDEAGEVRAVVEVEATHQVLVGLALARMDRDHQARHGLVELPNAVDRPQDNFLTGYRPLAGGHCLAQQVLARGGDDDFGDGSGVRG